MARRSFDTGSLSQPDILQHVSVKVPCSACGLHYDVPLRQVLESQQLLHAGCPVTSETECPPVTYAALVNEATLRRFADAWTQLAAQVRSQGLELVVSRPLLSH